VQAAAGLLIAAVPQEHERAAGAWHAEWEPLREALALTGGASAATRSVIEGLHVDTDRMRANLDAAGGVPMVESAETRLLDPAGYLGSADAFVDRALDEYRSHR
jgi:3-carboxy-cis,cis-muconate cycloisomerase